jgi:hypothetical protein
MLFSISLRLTAWLEGALESLVGQSQGWSTGEIKMIGSRTFVCGSIWSERRYLVLAIADAPRNR